MHKYMNKELHLCAVIMHSKLDYKVGKKNKIFDNLLRQNFTVDCKNKVWTCNAYKDFFFNTNVNLYVCIKKQF